MIAAITIILGYLLGSIPMAYIVGRLAKGVDIRKLGDGNMGAANTYREIGHRAGIGVGVADVAKGASAMLLAEVAGVGQPIVYLTGVAAVSGHSWPVFLRFRGGIGASTAGGVLGVLLPREMSILLAAGTATLLASGNIIVASAVLFAPLPFLAWLFGASWSLIAYAIGLPCLVGFSHFLKAKYRPQPKGALAPSNGEVRHLS